MHNPFFPASLVAGLIAFLKLLAGAGVRWVGCRPDTRQRVYFANHGSHLDTFVLWKALHPEARPLTRPVAARDYWMANRARQFLAGKIFHAVFVERRRAAVRRSNSVEPMLDALADGQSSLILFPEGTRGTGSGVGPFKGGLYYLAKQRPDVELVPAFIEHRGKVLPGGRSLPGKVSFGAPLHLESDEEKFDFLSRARDAVNGLRTA